ncbi:cache domain-containing sensor histidine kinase [Cohnella soli]|uniref:histidine kinase n=1 Tax=Cohnella soli TaxID=425005 RepID=A0ABW0I0R4_9BACL
MIPLPNHFRTYSFKTKLFLSYMLIVLIPVSISAAWIYDRVLVPTRGERILLIEQSMNQLQTTVDKDLDDMEKIGYLISTNIVLKKSMLKRYYDESEIIEVMNTSIQSLLSWFEATNKDIGQFHFFTHNETLPESNFFMPVSLFAASPWFKQMIERVKSSYPYWESNHEPRDYPYSRKVGSAVYSMFYPINDEFPDDTSYLEFEMDTGRFFSKLETLSLAKSGFVTVVDWDGKLAYSPSRVRDSTQGIADSLMRSGGRMNELGSGKMTYNGTTYRFVVKPIERLHTSFVGLVPIQEIEGPWSDAKYIFIVLIVLLTILLAALSYLLSGLLMKRLVGIVRSVRKIQNGNFQVRIPVRGEDEIDWLAININSMAGQIDDLINRVYKSQVSQKEAELSALQAQINPHFLFNTLETLRMMAEARNEQKLSDALTALGSMMRITIAGGNHAVSLENEIEHIRDYVYIQNLLHNNRISFHCDIAVPLLAYRIPNLLLQPLVENSIIHGMKGHSGILTISIIIEEEHLPTGSLLRFEVMDNGCGISPEKLERIVKLLVLKKEQRTNVPDEVQAKQRGGVGLTNVHDRILYTFGPLAEVKIQSQPGKGTTIIMKLPTSDMT